MNREEAQFILGAYRPNSEDARDPQFREALELARRDPELARWFAQEQALDRAFSAKIRSRPVSPELKAQLLLVRTTARRRPVWWRRPAWLAVAAGLGVALASSGIWLDRGEKPADFAGFRAAMVAAASDMSDHADVWGLDHAGYRKWLAENQGTADFVLPAALADKAISACKVVGWDGRKVTMLCLKFGGRHLDVFVIDAAELPGVRLDATLRFFTAADVTAAAWQRDGKIYLAAGAMPRADLQQLL